MLGTNPQGITTASTPILKTAIGFSQPDSIALLSQTDNNYAESGTGDAAIKLSQWISDWRAVGRPSFDQYKPLDHQTKKICG
ncbi:MAG: hypothetical protein QNJ70_04855 [Xenococcaceae cyanobacterium MO_207.B15]|nr:hypothetical protein [Xenococcaceae cyanobacterium MO_207.B15]MDJ0744660.1 hypothetical protein [Xenococcaceae cyanobacterium MO_167.B27]